MNELERDLREVLGRQEPPPGFADRVLRETLKADTQQSGGKWRRWAAAAALVAIVVGGLALERNRLHQREVQRTKEELMIGLRVTGAQLRAVQERWLEIQRRVVQPQVDQ